MYTIPSFCLRFMGLSSALRFGQVQLLTALMLFLTDRAMEKRRHAKG